MKKKRYIFTLMKGGQPVATYIGDCELPPDVVAHEYSIPEMKEFLAQYGYTLLRRF